MNDKLVKIIEETKENQVQYETNKNETLDYSRSLKVPSSNSFVRDSNIKQPVPILDLTSPVKSEDLNPAETVATIRNHN